jgi:hypothetical protein
MRSRPGADVVIVAVAMQLAGSTGSSSWYAHSAEGVQDRPVGDAEVAGDRSQRLAVLVHHGRSGHIVFGQDPVARLDTNSSEDGEDGGSVDIESRGESVGGFAGQVALEDTGSVRIG